MSSNPHLWVVILAAGEGTRVRHLTRDRWGLPAPKQYSSIDGRTTLIEATLVRARKIAPPERIVVVVARQHRRWWSSDLAEIPPENVIPQPENRGTAAGILLPLLRIAGRDPEARLVILPSDHGVSSEETLHSAITEAISLSTCSKLDLVLLGVRPDGPETGYGWIVPRPGGQGRLSPVASFHEKPDALTAAALLAQGGLLNSLILIAGARFLLALFETVLPPLWRVMQPLLGKTRDGLRFEPDLVGLYRSVPSFDFSKDVLELVAPDLWVQPVPECGWLDLGTPERLTGHLFRQGRPSRGEPAPGEKPWPPQMPHSHSVTLETTEPTVGAVAHAVA